MEAGEKVTGCTVHYVNEELDGGEIIMQGEVPILPDDDVESLTKAIQRKEYAILPAAIDSLGFVVILLAVLSIPLAAVFAFASLSAQIISSRDTSEPDAISLHIASNLNLY
jgi:hypothetical protein